MIEHVVNILITSVFIRRLFDDIETSALCLSKVQFLFRIFLFQLFFFLGIHQAHGDSTRNFFVLFRLFF